MYTSVHCKKWVDWVGRFHKTFAKVDKFNQEEQKQYLSGLVEKIDIRLDAETNEHLIDIQFQYPIVEDEYKVLTGSDKISKSRQYEVIDGKYNKELKGTFNFKQSGVKKKQ